MTLTCTARKLRIGEVRFAEGYGKIGFTFYPGETRSEENRLAYGRDVQIDCGRIERWDAAASVTLVTPAERDDPAVPRLGNAVWDETRIWHYLPLCYDGLPDPAFDNVWQASGKELRAVLRAGFNVLVHCETSLSRSGLVAARLLIELGMHSGKAVKAVCALDPGAIETPAEFDYIMQLEAVPDYVPPRSREAMVDRALGAMLGLAVGDAWRGAYDRRARDPDGEQVERGWRQGISATATALALADSLLARGVFDAGDFMTRLGDWHENGAYSCTGDCLDIGLIVRTAWQPWKQFGDPSASSTNPRSAGSGSLVRMAPVVVRHWSDRRMLIDVATRQSQTTHGAPEAIDACIALAEVMVDALAGLPRGEVLRPRRGLYTASIATVMAGSWRGKHPRDLAVSSHVAHTLAAALWCVGRSDNLRDAVGMAAHLGNDAGINPNIIAAVTGQLAGAIYGASAISVSSPDEIAWRERITDRTNRLFATSWPA